MGTPKCGDGFARALKVAPFLKWIDDHKSCPAVDGPPSMSFVDLAANCVCLVFKSEIDSVDLLEFAYIYYTEGLFIALKRGLKILLDKLLKWFLRNYNPFY